MARKVNGPAPGGRREYIPEVFENREDPDPLKVTIKDPTEAEKREMVKRQTALLTDGSGAPILDEHGNPRISVNMDGMLAWQLAAVTAHVEAMSGYEVRGIDIDTGAKLAEHGETELISEIALEILTGAGLTEGEKKS